VDVVLSDSPITFMARAELAVRLRKGFPASLHGAPVLLPSADAVLRRNLDTWFDARGIRPVMAGEFEDSALLKVFGQAGAGFFTVPTVIETEARRQYEVEPIAATDDISERFYAISVERRVRHPAVAAICEAARSELLA
jgi:LysR family transcriptional activator of nhaA